MAAPLAALAASARNFAMWLQQNTPSGFKTTNRLILGEDVIA